MIAGMAVFFTYPSIIAYPGRRVAVMPDRDQSSDGLPSIDEAPGETFATAAMAAQRKHTGGKLERLMGLTPL
ncbi:MAG: hypothetical protein R3D29_05530 [Nitratireductor sp.]